MSIERMADRTLPLAERVRGLATVPDSDAMGKPFEDAVTELLADIAAADRLARATDAGSLARDFALDRLYAAPDPIRGTDAGDGEASFEAAYREYEDALDAYRAHMAQGVDRGE